MHKRFFIEYESDRVICHSNRHNAGNASTLKSAKAVIRNIRKNDTENNPRHFCVYDCWAETDPVTNFAPLVYEDK